MNFNARNETARGYLLLCVFFIHSLYAYTWFTNDWHQAPLSYSLIKIFAPQISIYFFLNGMSMRGIGNKSLRAALPQSLMLIFLAWVSEGIGIVLLNALYGGYGHGLHFIKQAIKPMLYGTGGCTAVTWFFTVLAAARLLVWIYERNKIDFVLSWAVIVTLILLGKRLHAPDNLWEWRNWPVATLFMLAGMKMPRDWRVPAWIALPGLVIAIVLTWFDVPGILEAAPCLMCNINFVSEPMVSSYGFLPIFLIEQVLLFLFILWGAQSPPAIIGKLGRYFGRPSLQFLLLHGWILITIIPAVMNALPEKESVIVLLGIAVLNPPLHALIYKYMENPLNRVLAFCFEWGRRVTEWCTRPAVRSAG